MGIVSYEGKSEHWGTLLWKNRNDFKDNYDEDQYDEDLKTFSKLQEHRLLVLEYEASWRGTAQWPQDESRREIPWLIFAVKKDAIASDFVNYLRHRDQFQTTIWELRGCESREPLYSNDFCKLYMLDSESHNWMGMKSRSDRGKLSLKRFELDHLTFDVYVCKVGMRIDFETLDKMDSETFYNHIKDMDLVGDICTAMDEAHIDNHDI
ncbi:hypothetical protein Forpe1208_v017009 [Fusarium oxysporum f. sp. rapae]|uniref:Uncharacterized protein n=1 Tax=Fusarium oxysporum f. sp. rapae TaxID=485398 RepID=A0A8J5NDN8_FUSOX|nr:hypothetical protein Forpe1208_v017009 [Fusarium oxysporum f. sp. rapae]